MNFSLVNEGVCIRLKLFGEEVRSLLKNNSWEEVDISKADYIFVNSCSFLKSKEEESLNRISHFNNKLFSNQIICVFGCLPSTDISNLNKLSDRFILLNRDLNDFSNKFNLNLEAHSSSHVTSKSLSSFGKFVFLFNKYFLFNPSINYRLNKEKVFHIKISDGCLGKCSYCSERFTTKFKSRKIFEVLNDFNDGLEKGYKIFSLNSDDTSCFGIDNKETIYYLLEGMLSRKEDFKLVITEFNPKGLNDSRIFKILKDKRIIFITLPIQSGSQRVLNRMNRPYRIKNVLGYLKRIKEINPSIKINTHLIVGFPGETDYDFFKTVELVKKGLFDRVKVFVYNDRLNTPASTMKNKLSDEIKHERKNKLNKTILINDFKHFSLSNLLMGLIDLKGLNLLITL